MLVARVDGRQGRRDPAGLDRGRRIGARAHLPNAELRPASTSASRTASPSSHGPNSSQPGWPTMPCRRARTCRPPMVNTSMWKNLISGTGLPGDLLHHLERVGTLDLIAIGLAAALVLRRSLVASGGGVVAARLEVELHPVGHRRAADDVERVLAEVEEDRVADHVALGVAAHDLLAGVDLERLEAVHADVGQQLQRVGPLDVQVRHVMRLVEERARFAPRALLVAPVGELVLHHRKGIGTDLGIAQQVHRGGYRLQQLLQVLIHSDALTPPPASCRGRISDYTGSQTTSAALPWAGPCAGSSMCPWSLTMARFRCGRDHLFEVQSDVFGRTRPGPRHWTAPARDALRQAPGGCRPLARRVPRVVLAGSDARAGSDRGRPRRPCRRRVVLERARVNLLLDTGRASTAVPRRRRESGAS